MPANTKMFLATYDIRSTSPKNAHSQFLVEAEKRGWCHWMADAKARYRMTNTTVDGWFPTYAAAFKAFSDAAVAARAATGPSFFIEKWIIVEYVAAHIDSDVKRPL